MSEKLTPWFPGSVKPARPGLYEVGHAWAMHRNSRNFLTGHRRFFNGKHWRAGWCGESVSIFGNHPSHVWRGLASDPSKGQP